MCERRAASVERDEVAAFVVGSAVLPTFPEDADPFESECAQDGLMTFSSSLLLSVEGLGPDRTRDGLTDPFNKTLPQKFRAVPTPMHPHKPTAFFPDGRDAGVFLERGGVRVTRAIRAERGQKPRSQDRPRSRQLSKQSRIWVSGEGLGNAVFQILDRDLERTQLGDEQRGLGNGNVDDGCVRGKRSRGRDAGQSFLNQGRAAGVVGLIKTPQSRRACRLNGGERWPSVKEVEWERSVHFVSDQIEELRKMRLHGAAQLVSKQAAKVDRFSACIDEQLEPPGLYAVAIQAAQPITMVFKEREQNLRIRCIVLGAGRDQSFAEPGTGRRMHRIDLQPGMFKQSMDNGVAAGLDYDRYRLAAEALTQLIKPGVQSLRRGTDRSSFLRAPVREHESVGGIAPV